MRPHHPGAIVLCIASALVQAQTPTLHLIPIPRQVEILPVQELPQGVHIACPACDPQDQFAADDLAVTLRDRGIPVAASGFTIQVARRPAISFPLAQRAEGYTITVSGLTLTVSAASAPGMFYGVQTVKQLIEGSGGSAVLHAATIHDWPAMQYRGLDDDLSRGPIVTLEYQKKQIRTIAAYKLNVYSPYFENTFAYTSNPLSAPPNGAMTAADAHELTAYAARYHVTIIPEQEAFGHLHHTLVYEQYQTLAETPHGAVLAPGQPGSIALTKQWFTELAAGFPGPFLHLGADETVDLGLGQTKADVDARGLGAVYLDNMQQIVNALKPLNRRLLFWGDIAMDSPALVKAMPASFKSATIAVAWSYEPDSRGFARWITPYTNAGFETWVSPGINNWSRVYPNYNYGLENIQQFTRDGQRYGATGQLNTIWNDDGEGLADSDWYGILFGAAAAWQPGESSIPAFEQSYAQVFHGDSTGLLNQAQIELMAAHALLKQQAKIGDGSDGLYWVDPMSKDGQTMAVKLRPYLHELRLHAETALTLIAQARAAAPCQPTIPKCAAANPGGPSSPDFGQGGVLPPIYPEANAYPSAPTSLRETNAIDALELGARRFDLIGLKFQLCDEIAQGYQRAQSDITSPDPKQRKQVSPELSDINGPDGRIQDIKDAYSLQRDLYAQTWLRSNRPYALRPVLEHFDYTIARYLALSDRVKSAQRQYAASKTLPSAADLGIPPATY
jgi:hexosaminidase